MNEILPFDVQTKVHRPFQRLTDASAHQTFWPSRHNYIHDYSNRFTHETPLQSGSTCTVSKVVDRAHNKVVVLKMGNLSVKKSMDREFDIVQSLGSHPHIARIHEKFVDFPNRRVCLVMECCDGGDLVDILARADLGLSMPTFLCFALQLTDGLRFVHSKGVAHRDIKGDNICTSKIDGTIKIVDFGEAQHISEPVTYLRKGTLPYLAPELVAEIELNSSIYNVANQEFDLLKADVFSLGITFFSMVTSELPFNVASMSDSRFRAFKHTCQLGSTSTWKTIPPELKMLLVGMCHVDPTHRWSMGKVDNYLKDILCSVGA